MFKSVLGVEDKSESQEDAITTDSEIKIDLTEEKPEIKHKSNTDGGEGSGNYGHKGRRGSVGGSAKSSASTSKGAERRQKKKTVTTNKTKSEKSGKSVDITEKNDIIKKQEEIRRKLVDNIVNDVFPSKFTGDQEKHLYNERYRCPTKSYFLKNFEDVFAYQDEQLKEYLLRVANIGKMAYKGNNIRAIVKYDEIIGVYREGDTRKEIETKFVLFIFSKDGVHCMPMYEHNNKG